MKIPSILLFLTVVYVTNAALGNSSVVRALKGGRDRLREFLTYDVECNWLTPDELAIRVSQERCPPQTTTITPVTYQESYFKRKKRAKKEKRLKKIKGIFSHNKKKKFLMIMSMGQQNLDELDAKTDHEDYRLLAGTMLQITCNAANRSANGTDIVSWFVNGRLIEPAILDWRVSIGEKGDLSVYPVQLDDGGSFECFVNNSYEGSVTIVVITRTEAIVDGILNYLIVASFFIIVALFAVVLVNGTASRPPEPSLRNDKMAQFLEEHVLKNGQEARENIAKVVYGRDLDKRRQVVEASKKSGRSQRGNKDTIMTILQPPKSTPSVVAIGSGTSLRKRRTAGLPKLSVDPPAPVAPLPFVQPTMLPPSDPFFASPVLTDQHIPAPQPGFGLPQPEFGSPQPGFAAPQPGFAAPQPGFAAPQPGFGFPQPGFAAPQPGFPSPGKNIQQNGQQSNEAAQNAGNSVEKVEGSRDKVAEKKSRDTVAPKKSKDTVAPKKSKENGKKKPKGK